MGEMTLGQTRDWIRATASLVEKNAAWLNELDTAIGDGDHGTNMSRGFTAVEKKLDSVPQGDIGALFKTTGMTLLSSVGGAAGPLYGGMFLEMAKHAAGKNSLSKAEVDSILEAGLADIRRRGKAELGDKTIVDSFTPGLASFKLDASFGVASRQAADSARLASESTKPLQARKGRASYLGERSIGHQDPGATSTSLLFQALASVFATN